MTADLRRRLVDEAEASEAGKDLDGVFHRNRVPAKEPSQVYSVRMPVERIDEIRALAAQQSTAPTSLMRRWVLERLDDELARRAEAAGVPGRRSTAHADDDVILVRRSDLQAMVGDLIREQLAAMAHDHSDDRDA